MVDLEVFYFHRSMGVVLGTLGCLALGFASFFLCFQRHSFTKGEIGLVITYSTFVRNIYCLFIIRVYCKREVPLRALSAIKIITQNFTFFESIPVFEKFYTLIDYLREVFAVCYFFLVIVKH